MIKITKWFAEGWIWGMRGWIIIAILLVLSLISKAKANVDALSGNPSDYEMPVFFVVFFIVLTAITALLTAIGLLVKITAGVSELVEKRQAKNKNRYMGKKVLTITNSKSLPKVMNRILSEAGIQTFYVISFDLAKERVGEVHGIIIDLDLDFNKALDFVDYIRNTSIETLIVVISSSEKTLADFTNKASKGCIDRGLKRPINEMAFKKYICKELNKM